MTSQTFNLGTSCPFGMEYPLLGKLERAPNLPHDLWETADSFSPSRGLIADSGYTILLVPCAPNKANILQQSYINKV